MEETLKAHPAADLFPLLDKERLEQLAQDIKTNGLREPIRLYQGDILDGRNRYAACQLVDVDPRFHEVEASIDPWAYVWSLNGERRDLVAERRYLIWKRVNEHSEAWRATQDRISAEANKARSEAAKAGKVGRAAVGKDEFSASTKSASTKPGPEPGKRAKAAASKTNRGAVYRMDALDRARPDLAEQVIAGEIRPAEALRQMKRAKVEAEVTAQLAVKPSGPPIVVQADATAWLESVAPASVDLLLTDPPYSTDVEDIAAFAQDWLPKALRTLKPTGRAFVCVGAYPAELAAYMAVAMPTQVLVWTYRNTIGPSPSHLYKHNWQAILYYTMPDAPPLDCPQMVEQFSVQDINAPDGRLGDRYHAWQKPTELGERFVRHTTRPGDTVLDPFTGTGSFLLAAATLGRVGVGCELDPAMIATAVQRGCVSND